VTYLLGVVSDRGGRCY